MGSAEAVEVAHWPVRKWVSTPCTSAVFAVFAHTFGMWVDSQRQR